MLVNVVNIIEELYPTIQKVAMESPCTRRKYGAAIVAVDRGTGKVEEVVYAENSRVTDCCQGNACVRDMLGIQHAQSVEKGAEVHAEQAALIKWNPDSDKDWRFVIAGFRGSNREQLTGKNLYPCYTCARMIAFAGFTKVYLRGDSGRIESVSIRRILKDRELEWEPA